MITSVTANRELKRMSGSNQILLTLKKNPGGSCINAVIKSILPRRDIKQLNLNGNSHSHSHSLSLKELHSLAKSESIDVTLPKITQIYTNKTSSISNRQQTSLLKDRPLTETNFLRECTSLLNGCQLSHGLVKKPKKIKPKDPNWNNFASTVNKNNRFVPNILRNTKTGEESSNNSFASVGFWPLLAARIKSNKDRKSIKRKRKQVLVSEESESSFSQRNQSVPKKDTFDLSNSAEKSAPSAIEVDVSNGGNEDVNRALELCLESLKPGEEEPRNESLDRNDWDRSKIEISLPIENSASISSNEAICTDKSVQKILEEFKEPDYKNYVITEDLCFDEIDEMEKLLSSHNNEENDSPKESSVFNDSAKVVEYDVNGNDIENCGNATGMSGDRNRWESNNTRYFNDGGEGNSIAEARKPKFDINLDDILSHGPNRGGNMISSRTELWTNKFDNYFHPSDYSDEFQSNVKQISSSLDTVSEFENNIVGCLESVNTSLLEKKDSDYSVASLAAVSDAVPRNVFSCVSNEADSDGFESVNHATKQLPDFYSTTPRKDVDSGFLDESVEKLTNDFQLFDNIDENLKFMEVDDDFSFDRDFSNENLIFERRTDHGVKMSGYLESDDNNFANDCQFPTNVQLLSHQLNSLEDTSSPDLDSQFGTSDTSTFGSGSPLFNDDAIDNTADNDSRVVYDLESKFSHFSENEKYPCENEPGTKELRHLLSENRNGNLTPRYVDGMDSCSRCSPPFIVKRNLDKLEDMLAGKKTLEDYSNAYFAPSVACDVKSDSMVTDNKNMRYFGARTNFNNDFYSQDKGCSQMIWRSKEFGYRNIERNMQVGHAPRETNISSLDSTNILNYNTLQIARKNHWLGSNSSCDEASLNHQLYSFQISSKKSRASEDLLTVVKKSNQAQLIDQKKRNDKNEERNITFVHCGCCNEKYATTQELTNHIKAVHNNETRSFITRKKTYACGKCSKEYCFPGAVEKHLKLHENYSLTCRKCGEHFSERRLLTFHAYHYHFNRQFKCNYCKKKFARRNDRTRHLKECCGIDER